MKKTVKKYVAQNVAQKPANPHSRAILTQLSQAEYEGSIPFARSKRAAKGCSFFIGRRESKAREEKAPVARF